MLISRTNNFVFIRVPKTGSTSALFYFLNSGLYDSSKDTVALDGNFYSWKQMQEYFVNYPEDYLEKSRQVPHLDLVGVDRKVHSTYAELIKNGKIKDKTPCYSVIRNPVSWLCSIYFYTQKQRKVSGLEPVNVDVNEFCYSACIVGEEVDPDYAKLPQCYYIPDHAKLWNTENLHEHAVADITAMGGVVGNRIHVRKTHSTPKDYQALLSHEVIQMMEVKYLKDFELWEKAYARCN